jgi:hypothetical protein
MILKIFFLPKNLGKIVAFLAQTTATFFKIVIITLVFDKNAIFAKNWQKSQKIVIITLNPGANPTT